MEREYYGSLLVHTLNGCNDGVGPSQSQELFLCLAQGYMGQSTRVVMCCFPRGVRAEQDEKWNSLGSGTSTYMGYWCHSASHACLIILILACQYEFEQIFNPLAHEFGIFPMCLPGHRDHFLPSVSVSPLLEVLFPEPWVVSSHVCPAQYSSEYFVGTFANLWSSLFLSFFLCVL